MVFSCLLFPQGRRGGRLNYRGAIEIFADGLAGGSLRPGVAGRVASSRGRDWPWNRLEPAPPGILLRSRKKAPLADAMGWACAGEFTSTMSGKGLKSFLNLMPWPYFFKGNVILNQKQIRGKLGPGRAPSCLPRPCRALPRSLL